MHCFFKFLWIVISYRLIFGIHQSALAVALEYCAKVPAVSMVVRELRVFKLWIELGDSLGKLGVAPQSPGGSLLGVAIQYFAGLCDARLLLFFGPHERCIGFVVPHSGSIK